MPKTTLKKKCANQNCTNPKCPFPHYESPDAPAVEEIPKKAPKKIIKATYLPYSTGELNKIPSVRKVDPPHARGSVHNSVDQRGRVCTRCRTEFFLTAEHKKWFLERGMVLPYRCVDCRKFVRESGSAF